MQHETKRCSSNFLRTFGDISACITLQEACSIIQTHPVLYELNSALVANIITYFYCHSCHEIPDSLRIQTSQIFMFKLTPKNEVIAYTRLYPRLTMKIMLKYLGFV